MNRFSKRLENKMTRREAEAILGLSGAYSDADVKIAYRSLASKNHPDRGGDSATMQRINNAKEILDDSSTDHIGKTDHDYEDKRQKTKDFIADDLKSKIKVDAFIKHFEMIFGEPFTAKVNLVNSTYTVGINIILKNMEGDKMFEMSVHPDIYSMDKNKGSFGSSSTDIPYSAFIAGSNFSDNRKQKLSDFAWTNNSSKFADPETVFPKSKIVKKSTRKFSKRDMLQALQALDVVWSSDRNGVWLPLADGNFLHIVRISMMGTGGWTVYGTCARKGKYGFSDIETMVKSFEENENVLAAFRRFTKMNADQVLAAVKKMSHDGTP